jgi:hypothetical protein
MQMPTQTIEIQQRSGRAQARKPSSQAHTNNGGASIQWCEWNLNTFSLSHHLTNSPTQHLVLTPYRHNTRTWVLGSASCVLRHLCVKPDRFLSIWLIVFPCASPLPRCHTIKQSSPSPYLHYSTNILSSRPILLLLYKPPSFLLPPSPTSIPPTCLLQP